MLFQTLYPNLTPIFECYHGSKLHGTNGPDSDTDIKGVYLLPTLQDYMETRGNHKNTPTPKNGLEGPDKIEEEWIYIQDLAIQLGKMQTNNVSMLFAPRELWLHTSHAWEELVENRHRVMSKSIAAYAGYCQSQAAKYTLKGGRYQTVKDFYEYVNARYLDGHYKGNSQKMTEEQWMWLELDFSSREGVSFWTNPTGESMITVVAKSFSKTAPVDLWLGPIKSLLDNYGDRAKKANQDGKDIKAVYHAYRIAKEAQEILTTGELRYPSLEVEMYKRIRANEFSYESLQDMIVEELAKVYALQEASTLPETPDQKWLQEWAIYWQQEQWGLW